MLPEIIRKLERAHGRPSRPRSTDPLAMILEENVAYLVSDQQRRKAFQALRERIGLEPRQILSASPDALFEIARLGGMKPGLRLQKLLRIAQIALETFGGDLRGILVKPPAQAKKALRLFPGIGEPGAEKILLFSGAQPVLALDSNGLRVLLRLGFGRERKNYAASYRSAQEATKGQIRKDCSWLVRAHQLLRLHGQRVCRRSEPVCSACPLTAVCRYYQERRAR